jgi:hypothetical protein
MSADQLQGRPSEAYLRMESATKVVTLPGKEEVFDAFRQAGLVKPGVMTNFCSVMTELAANEKISAGVFDGLWGYVENGLNISGSFAYHQDVLGSIDAGLDTVVLKLFGDQGIVDAVNYYRSNYSEKEFENPDFILQTFHRMLAVDRCEQRRVTIAPTRQIMKIDGKTINFSDFNHWPEELEKSIQSPQTAPDPNLSFPTEVAQKESICLTPAEIMAPALQYFKMPSVEEMMDVFDSVGILSQSLKAANFAKSMSALLGEREISADFFDGYWQQVINEMRILPHPSRHYKPTSKDYEVANAINIRFSRVLGKLFPSKDNAVVKAVGHVRVNKDRKVDSWQSSEQHNKDLYPHIQERAKPFFEFLNKDIKIERDGINVGDKFIAFSLINPTQKSAFEQPVSAVVEPSKIILFAQEKDLELKPLPTEQEGIITMPGEKEIHEAFANAGLGNRSELSIKSFCKAMELILANQRMDPKLFYGTWCLVKQELRIGEGSQESTQDAGVIDNAINKVASDIFNDPTVLDGVRHQDTYHLRPSRYERRPRELVRIDKPSQDLMIIAKKMLDQRRIEINWKADVITIMDPLTKNRRRIKLV